MNKRYYNVELAYQTREDIRRADAYKEWLQEHGIRFETSACGVAPCSMVHFEVLLSPEELKQADAALDALVWFDCIEEVRCDETR